MIQLIFNNKKHTNSVKITNILYKIMNYIKKYTFRYSINHI